jgi:hypothetical protein
MAQNLEYDLDRLRIAQLEEECRLLEAELKQVKAQADEIVRALNSPELQSEKPSQWGIRFW